MPTLSHALYPIDECPELMADACVCDSNGTLIFLSLWGRDTAIQTFLARLTLERDEQGLNQFHLLTEKASVPVVVGNVERLEKCSTRQYRRTLFGSLVNLWLFDKRCAKPDKANAKALALLHKTTPSHTDRLWALVRETCPLPLLDHWRDVLMPLLLSQSMLTRLPLALGALDGYELRLDVPVLTQLLGDMIRQRILTVSPDTAVRQHTSPGLRRVA
ncbi:MULTISPECIES: hypothetical protein [unclassified Serratia (in: enterobacteria)]|uniref:hypothetical protein n=1 Tax=unclassified Serratia (in: enterobacteria) TaxID=2647522 RepID=UPI0030760D44